MPVGVAFEQPLQEERLESFSTSNDALSLQGSPFS